MLAYIAIALNVAYAITFILITAFQCTPVNLVSVDHRSLLIDRRLITIGMGQLGQVAPWQMQQHQCPVVGFSRFQHRPGPSCRRPTNAYAVEDEPKYSEKDLGYAYV